MDIGTEIIAAQSGRVSYVGTDKYGGKYMDIFDSNTGIKTRYIHLSQFLVPSGVNIESGQLIALSGNTGFSSGPHLHFGTFIGGAAIDPMSLLENCTAPVDSNPGEPDNVDGSEDYMNLSSLDLFPTLDDSQIDIPDLLSNLMGSLQGDFKWILKDCNLTDLSCITWNIKEIAKRVVEYFTNIINGIIEAIKNAVSDLVKQIQDLISKIWDYVQNPMKLVTDVKDTIISIFNAIKGLFEDPGKIVKVIAQAIGDMLSKDTTGRAFLLGVFFGGIVAQKLIDWLTGGVFGFIKGVFDFIMKYVGQVGKVILKLVGLEGKLLKFGKSKVGVTIKNLTNKLGLDGDDMKKLSKESRGLPQI